MKSISAKTLLKISISIASEAEDAVVELLTNLFDQPASIYTDTEQRTTSAVVYTERFTPAQRRQLREGLRLIRAAGLELGAGRVTVQRVR